MEKMNSEQENSTNTPEAKESTPSSSPARGSWDILPDLVQKIILKKVNERETLLACRLVNTAWKKVADKILENQIVSKWEKWEPFGDSDSYSSSLPMMRLIADSNETSVLDMRWNHSALPITVNSTLGSPFPTNSMQMGNFETDSHGQWRMAKEWNPIERMSELISSYGHFLTCFSLNRLKIEFGVLDGILSNLGNLKALTLWRIELEEVSHLQNLPSLPNLKHLNIIDCDRRISQLVFNSHGGQITTLESTACPDSCPQPFTKLNQLKLIANEEEENRLFLQLRPSHFPSLQYFSIILWFNRFNWEEFIQMIDNLPEKLVDLHLDFPLDLKDELKIQNLNKTRSTFPCIRKLGIRFPPTKMHTEMVRKWLLPRFPQVKILNLVTYPYQYDNGDGATYKMDDEETKKKVVGKVTAGFWNEYSKLEKMFVYQFADLPIFSEIRHQNVN